MSIHPYEMPTWEALDLAAEEHVGRLVILDGDTPIALPVNYRLHTNDHRAEIVVRTAELSLIGRYSGPASMEIDHIDTEAMTAWSVLVRGRLEPIAGGHFLPDPEPWLGGRHAWKSLRIEAVSGRRFVGARATEGYAVDWCLAGA